MERIDFPDSTSTVTITRFDALSEGGKEVCGRELGSKEFRFDTASRLTHVLNYSSTGSMYYGYEYVFSEDGRMKTARDAEDSTDIDDIEYYDDKGKLIRISSWSAGHRETEFMYSSVGVLEKQIEYRYYAKDGTIDSRVEFEFNEHGLPEMSTYWVLYGKDIYDVVSTTWFTYDAKGRMKERKWTDYHGLVYFYERCEYNEKGQLVKDVYSSNKPHATEFWNETAYTYDERGYLSSTHYRNKYNNDLTTYAVEYNTSGLPSRCLTSCEGDSTIYIWTYTFHD